MKKVTFYEAQDGKVFKSAAECANYENIQSSSICDIGFYNEYGARIYPLRDDNFEQVFIVKIPDIINSTSYYNIIENEINKAFDTPSETRLRKLHNITASGTYFWNEEYEIFISKENLNDIYTEFKEMEYVAKNCGIIA